LGNIPSGGAGLIGRGFPSGVQPAAKYGSHAIASVECTPPMLMMSCLAISALNRLPPGEPLLITSFMLGMPAGVPGDLLHCSCNADSIAHGSPLLLAFALAVPAALVKEPNGANGFPPGAALGCPEAGILVGFKFPRRNGGNGKNGDDTCGLYWGATIADEGLGGDSFSPVGIHAGNRGLEACTGGDWG